jgi:hypothetical protein
MPTIMLVGHGRCGKDVGGEYLARITGLRFAGTTSKYLLKYVAAELKQEEEYAYVNRHANRQTWYEVGNRLRRNDPGLLIREALEHGDITGGVRDRDEIVHARRTGIIDLIVWVNNNRVDVDPTLMFSSADCDYQVDNHGTLEEYYFRLYRLAKFANLLQEGITCADYIPTL